MKNERFSKWSHCNGQSVQVENTNYLAKGLGLGGTLSRRRDLKEHSKGNKIGFEGGRGLKSALKRR